MIGARALIRVGDAGAYIRPEQFHYLHRAIVRDDHLTYRLTQRAPASQDRPQHAMSNSSAV